MFVMAITAVMAIMAVIFDVLVINSVINWVMMARMAIQLQWSHWLLWM